MEEMMSTPGTGSKRLRSRQACNDPCSQCIDFEYACHYVEKHHAASSAKTRKTEPKFQRNDSGGEPSPYSPSDHSNGIERGSSFVPFPEEPGFADPVRAKFAPAVSAVAFPRLLGLGLSQEGAPRLHCFGWNTGIRAEVPQPKIDITHWLSLSEAKELSRVYFEVVHPEIGFLDRKVYEYKIKLRWENSLDPKEYDGIIAGVTSLGSFFLVKNGHKNEAHLQHLLSEILHVSCGIYFPIINHIACHILKTIYLRLTTRPNAAWTSSCSMVHAMESTGIHKEHDSASFSNDMRLDSSEIMYRRRLFWVAYSLHNCLAQDYGRKKIDLDATTHMPKLDHSVSAPFLAIANCLQVGEASSSHGVKIIMLMTIFGNLVEQKTETDFHCLLKTDMLFSVYRRLRLLQYKLPKSQEEAILEVGSKALAATRRLADDQKPWYNVVSGPFQFVCVLLAIDSPASLALLPQAVQTIKHVSQVFDTFMVNQALEIANSLIGLARKRRAEDLARLDEALTQDQTSGAPDMNFEMGFNDPLFWGWMNDSFVWDLAIPPDKNNNGFTTQRTSVI